MSCAIREKLNSYVQNGDIAGGSILVRKNGETVKKEFAGFSDMEKGIPVCEDSVFRLASMSKPVAAAGILLLKQENKLSISDPLSNYLPEFSDLSVGVLKEDGSVSLAPLNRPVTIEDLLRHRSGMGQGNVSVSYGVNKVVPGISLKERAYQLSRAPLDFQPGAETGYSARCAFDVLGRVIEVVSGMELSAFLKEKFFDPLCMPDTAFVPNEDMKMRLVRLYDRSKGTLKDFYAPAVIDSPFLFSYPSGSAGLFGTLSDYDNFVQMLAGRGKRILSDETLAQMTVPDPTLASQKGAWGLGVQVFNKKSVSSRALAQGTFGWSGAFGTHFYIDPVNDITVTIMVNRLDIGGSGSYVSFGLEEAVFEEMHLLEE